jgi:hypothetical protein
MSAVVCVAARATESVSAAPLMESVDEIPSDEILIHDKSREEKYNALLE